MSYSLKFVIRDDRQNNSGLSPIYLRYTFQRQFYNIPLKESIASGMWDKHAGRPIPHYKEKNKVEESMDELERNVKSIITNFRRTAPSYPTIPELKILVKAIEDVKVKDEVTVQKAFQEYIKAKKAHVSAATVVVYNATLKRLTEFFQWNNQPMSWSSFDTHFDSTFKEYCFEKQFTKNTIGKYVRQIKAFLKWSSDVYHTVSNDQIKRLKVENESPDILSLNKKELEELKKHFTLSYFFDRDITKKSKFSPREHLVGRMFIFLCRTGLRFSDFDRLTYKHLHYEEELDGTPNLYFRIAPQKTKTTTQVTIPLLDDTLDLLFIQSNIPPILGNRVFWSENYAFKSKSFYALLKETGTLTNQTENFTIFPHYPRIFPKITNQEFNREIKGICKKIGFTSTVMLTQTIAGKVVSTPFEKWELISTHVGRKTFVTLSLEAGIRPEVIQRVTGHTDHRSMKPYIAITYKAVVNEFSKLTRNEVLEKNNLNERKFQKDENKSVSESKKKLTKIKNNPYSPRKRD